MIEYEICPMTTDAEMDEKGEAIIIKWEQEAGIYRYESERLESLYRASCEGMDIVDKIANIEVTYKSSELGSDEEIPKDENGAELTADMPINKPVITSITIETFGEDYGEPETLEPFNYYNYLMQYYGSSLSE